MREDFFKKLEEIYGHFQKEYISNIKGSCNGCISIVCCSRPPHYLSRLESDYLEKFLNDHSIKPGIKEANDFFVNRVEPDYCLYLNKDKGCIIYPARPVGCRTLGAFRFEDGKEVKLPEDCMFYGKEVTVAKKDKYRFNGIAEFIELKIKYDILKAKDEDEKLEYLILLGEEYTAQSRFSEAISILKEAEKLKSDDPLISFNLSCIYLFINEYPAASEELKKTLQFGGAQEFPELYLEACLNLAEGYIYENNLSEALSVIESVRDIKTDDPFLLSRLRDCKKITLANC
jgi:tetratricopeptide (TPR) repeat protein